MFVIVNTSNQFLKLIGLVPTWVDSMKEAHPFVTKNVAAAFTHHLKIKHGYTTLKICPEKMAKLIESLTISAHKKPWLKRLAFFCCRMLFAIYRLIEATLKFFRLLWIW